MKRCVIGNREATPLGKTCLVLLTALAFVALGGCRKQLATLSDLGKLQQQIIAEYRENGVSVNLNNDRYLTISFINSPLNSKSERERETRAQEIATFVKLHYPSIARLDELWVVFIQQEKRYVIVTYTKSLGYYGFDRDARPLGEPEENPARPALSVAHPTAVYSRERQQTDISISRLQLEGDGYRGLAVAPHYSVAGDISGIRRLSSAAPKSVGLDFGSYSSIQMFPGTSQITVLSDEKIVFETIATFTSTKSTDGGFSEFLLLEVPYPAFRQMTAGKKLVFRIGDREYILAQEQIAALREMTAYVKP